MKYARAFCFSTIAALLMANATFGQSSASQSELQLRQQAIEQLKSEIQDLTRVNNQLREQNARLMELLALRKEHEFSKNYNRELTQQAAAGDVSDSVDRSPTVQQRHP